MYLIKKILLLALASLLFIGCVEHQQQTSFMLNKRTIGGKTTVLVLPLENLTGYKSAARETGQVIEQILSADKGIRLIDRAEVSKQLKQKKIPKDLVDRRLAIFLGKKYGADYAILGSILEYGLYKTIVDGKIRGSEPVVSLHLRIVDLLRQNFAYAAINTSSKELGLSFQTTTPRQLMEKLVRESLTSFFTGAAKEQK